ncbi:MAG: glutaredoxin family protein [Candidatus Nanopelagicales bacterium]
MTRSPRVTVVGKPDCHLCEQAIEVVAQVCEQLGQEFRVVSITEDPNLADLYWEKIPVILVDGEPFDFWRVNRDRLVTKLSAQQFDNRTIVSGNI